MDYWRKIIHTHTNSLSIILCVAMARNVHVLFHKFQGIYHTCDSYPFPCLIVIFLPMRVKEYRLLIVLTTIEKYYFPLVFC
jgi:hypothetical protein